ncbi:unnamed protein product [Heterobilharzia americana]|nr:unnamed protein product [Heterobilharzia americana]
MLHRSPYFRHMYILLSVTKPECSNFANIPPHQLAKEVKPLQEKLSANNSKDNFHFFKNLEGPNVSEKAIASFCVASSQ